MAGIILRAWHKHGHAAPWIAGACALIVIAAASGALMEAAGKLYAIIGTVVAAVPFFRESQTKEARDALDRARGETEEDQKLLEAARRRLDEALSVFQPGFVTWMRAALTFAFAAFAVDLWLALAK